LDLLCEQRDRVVIDRPALTGLADAGHHLGPAERFGHAAALDDRQHRLFHRGEAAPALRAGPAAADQRAIVGLPRIHDAGVGVSAVRTTHGVTSLWAVGVSSHVGMVNRPTRTAKSTARPVRPQALWITYPQVVGNY